MRARIYMIYKMVMDLTAKKLHQVARLLSKIYFDDLQNIVICLSLLVWIYAACTFLNILEWQRALNVQLDLTMSAGGCQAGLLVYDFHTSLDQWRHSEVRVPLECKGTWQKWNTIRDVKNKANKIWGINLSWNIKLHVYIWSIKKETTKIFPLCQNYRQTFV